MRFLIISHALHYKKNTSLFSYAPYVREINLWLKHVDQVEIVAPFSNKATSKIDLDYKHNDLKFTKIPEVALTSVFSIFKSLIVLPYIILMLFKACYKADHIHLRCPGNIGLLGCLVQMFFPSKTKTAKYAGNWDPKAIQPKSYIIQKRILSNTTLTKKMNVLVYGKWENQTKNIKPFFTATYTKNELVSFKEKNYDSQLNFIFVGSLVEGKRPLLAIKIVESLQELGYNCKLDVFGNGILKTELENYIVSNQIKNVCLHGNQTKETIKKYLEKSHFSILASKSEGWPKAVAEAMFYGVIPIATSISCVPFMLDYGKRGILIDPELNSALKVIEKYLLKSTELTEIAKQSQIWSQQYTLDYFESEIKTVLTV
jgi:glycosyltransferase involved in cell wall biosynthesis